MLDKEKAIEALVYIAQKVPGVGRFHAAKILYFAERFHLREFGRPIVGDQYIAMENGPVPSFAYNVLKDALGENERELAKGALIESDAYRHPEYEAGRDPDLSYFSATDIECLDRAINHCAKRSFGSISDETHKHRAWDQAIRNGPMSYEDMMDGVDPDIIEDARAFAAYGVL